MGRHSTQHIAAPRRNQRHGTEPTTRARRLRDRRARLVLTGLAGALAFSAAVGGVLGLSASPGTDHGVAEA
jgi:hypothetical protein